VIGRLTQDLLREHTVVRLIGAGAAVSAPLHPGGRIASPAILADWEADIGAPLRARLRTPVTVGNDANLGALAEVTFGAAVGERDVLYVMLSAGIGIGMILHGRLYEGHSGVAGELGHVITEPGGAVCRCGVRGCLETVAGTQSLLGATGAPTLDALLDRVAAGDRPAQRAVRTAGEHVGAAVASVCRVLDPAKVVVGGDLAAAGEAVLSPIRAAFAEWERAPKLVLGTLGPEAEALGAAAAAMRTSATITQEHQ
jgi:predicted NBD/HSP70 family sugar kinase